MAEDIKPKAVYGSVKNRIRKGFPPVKIKPERKPLYLHSAARKKYGTLKD